MASVKRFQTRGRQFQPIQRYQYTDDLIAEDELRVHSGATKRRKAPQSRNNRFVSTGLDGVKASGGGRIRGGTSNPISNSKFV